MRPWPWSALLAAPLCLAPAGSGRAAPDPFADRVAPLLSRRCLHCHNPAKKRGGLDLSTRAAALKGGDSGPALVPGDAKKTLLLTMVSGPKPRMPRAGPKLTPGEVLFLRKWVDAGAPWPERVVLRPAGKAPAEEVWWSLRPLVRPAVPAVKDGGWVRNPVDSFVLAKLEEKGLAPSPEADRRTLIRRLTFDLHGLPPTPEEVDAFIHDRRPGAYERLVERLLASPAYGERWARHWLDVVHYGDTHGYDKDKRRDHAWPYRDYVIGSFNADKPYAQFIREQLAGDVLDPGSPEGVVATGFVVAGPWDFVGHVELREGTVDKLKTRLLDRDDMVSSTITTFMSLTVGCARCHDHKFDPIPQRDYYSLQAVFAGVERGDRPFAGPQPAEVVKLRNERKEVEARRIALAQKVASLTSPELARLDAQLKELNDQLADLPALPAGEASPSNGYHSAIEPKPDVAKWVQVDLGRMLPLDEVRLVPARPTDFPDTPGFGFPVRFRVELADEPSFRSPRILADHTRHNFPNPGDDPVVVPAGGRKARFVRVSATRLWKRTGDYVFALAELQVESGGKNVARGAAVRALDSIEAGRWARRSLVDGFDSRRKLPDLGDPKTKALLRKRQALRARVRQATLARKELADSLAGKELRAEVARVEARLKDLDRRLKELGAGPLVYAVVPRPPRAVHVLHRGDVEQPRAPASPGGLSCVSTLSPDFKFDRPADEGVRRAALAKWIADGRNPLTWRSAANRAWHYHFGKGIVATPGDFGRNGSRPTHPELLDWLAVEFRDARPAAMRSRGEGGADDERGSFKALHRLIVTSSAYRQSSGHDPAKAKVDADNSFLWRMNSRRLDAECVRDGVLAVSGRLDRSMGGPGFELFRFKDDHSPVYDHADPRKVHDPATYRGAVYRFVVRSVPNPFLECLDCADPNINTPVRNTTLTALQALALLNNPFMVRQATYFAGRLRKECRTPEEQVERAYRLAFGRPPDEKEKAAVLAYVKKHGLAKACRVLLNANEFVFVD